ncbi:MAG: endonuclease [Bacteroidota bacterium]
MKRFTLPFFLLTCLSLGAQPIFPDLAGQELLDALAQNYRPAVVLDYDRARDTLYSKIDVVNDSLFGVYTGFGVQMDPNEDPSSEAFANGLNTEHTWPQSKGAGNGNPRSDMHHLFPTVVQVNADRGSLPFGDIPDNSTERWYIGNSVRTTPPPVSIRNFYSEILLNNRFEPRESHKGNVARAMFYFYTVYRPEANAADPNYFPPMIETLCDWHVQDPVDQQELQRTEAIALRQSGIPNPFVVDCNLLARTYCPDQMDMNLCLSSNEDPAINAPFEILGVGRTEQQSFVMLRFGEPLRMEVDWYDLLGRRITAGFQDRIPAGTFQLNALSGGDYTGANTTLRSQHPGPIIARIRVQDAQGRWFTKSQLLP